MKTSNHAHPTAGGASFAQAAPAVAFCSRGWPQPRAVEDRKVIAIFDAKNHGQLAEIEAGDKPHGIRLVARIAQK